MGICLAITVIIGNECLIIKAFQYQHCFSYPEKFEWKECNTCIQLECMTNYVHNSFVKIIIIINDSAL